MQMVRVGIALREQTAAPPGVTRGDSGTRQQAPRELSGNFLVEIFFFFFFPQGNSSLLKPEDQRNPWAAEEEENCVAHAAGQSHFSFLAVDPAGWDLLPWGYPALSVTLGFPTSSRMIQRGLWSLPTQKRKSSSSARSQSPQLGAATLSPSGDEQGTLPSPRGKIACAL